MERRLIKEKIIDYCNSLGLDTIGFTECREFSELEEMLEQRRVEEKENIFETKEIEKRINPNLYMPEGNTIISIVFPYLYNKDTPGNIYFSKYTQGMDYHNVLKIYLKKICCFIESIGGIAMPFVDSNALPERYIAKLSGVGFIGKNQMLITKKYGSYVFLGEIITNLDLGTSPELEESCGECEACFKICPTSAINKDGCEPNKCLSFITQKKDLEEEWLAKLQGRLFGCDSCQNICPKNSNIEFSKLPEFMPFPYMESPDLQELLTLSKNEFNEKYKKTSCGWRGKNVLQRNALISAILLEKANKVENNCKNQYIDEYYHRLLKL